MTKIPFERDIHHNTAQMLWAIFGTGQVHYAVAHYDGNTVSYRPVDQPLDWTLCQQHLQKERTLGAYQLQPDSTVRWIGWDVDSPVRDTAREYALSIIHLLEEHQIPHAVEFSGSKGYHIFLFLEEPLPADKAMQFAQDVREILGLPKVGTDHVEAFPKQGKLTATNPYGNLIKLPLGEHPRTHEPSRFVDPHNGWENGATIDPKIALAHRVSWATLASCLSEPDPENQLVALLVPVWREGDRHALALSLAGFLATTGWGLEQTLELVERITVEAGDEDLKNRLDCVKDTFRTLSEGQPVVGMSQLREILPGAIIRQVIDIAGRLIAPELVQQIDRTRTMPKTPLFLKVRAAERIIWADLKENGRAIRTLHGQLFWYSGETHQVTSLDSAWWNAYLIKAYGINIKDSFSNQLIHHLRLHFMNEAHEVEVYRRSYWDGQKLFIHLDGPHVYVLDGYTIQIEYNGDCGYLFQNLALEPTMLDPSLPLRKEYEVWHSLVDDLSFTTSGDAPATPAQQKELLKAWILAFFFHEIMPTKPILGMLGMPGSGKTSAMRRLIKVLEEPQANVLGTVTDKSDAIRSSIKSHALLVLDNLEKTKAKGLAEIMNRLATGSIIELRKLYTTNETEILVPRLFVAITAVTLPWQDEAWYSRFLPIELDQIEMPLPEYQLQRKIEEGRVHIWHSLLQQLNDVVKHLHINAEIELSHRMRLADFAMFAKRLQGVASIDHAQLMAGLQSLVERQQTLLAGASALTEVLDLWMGQDLTCNEPRTLQELHKVLQSMANAYKIPWEWKTARSLAPHLRSLEPQLKKDFGLEVGFRTVRSRPRKTYAFSKDSTI